MTEDIYRSQFRLPYPLYEQLKASADENRRSVNAELVARLEESFRPPVLDPDDHIEVKGVPDTLYPVRGLLNATAHQYQRLAFVAGRFKEVKASLVKLEAERDRNAAELRSIPNTETLRIEDLRQRQFLLTSEIAALSMQAHMLEHEIRSAEEALNFRVAVPGVKGFDPAEE